MKKKSQLLFVCLLIVLTSGCGLAVKQVACTTRGGYSNLLIPTKKERVKKVYLNWRININSIPIKSKIGNRSS